MNRRTEFGKIYFELNNNPDSQELLNNFFVELGFEIVGRKGDQYFKRTTTFRDKHELQFDIIWYKNISTIRFGEWGKTFVDIKFEKIRGAWISNQNHLTLDFIIEGEQKGRISIYNGD